MRQAMIFAAGLGTRLKPLTDTMPKALIPVDGRPLLKHVVEKLKTAGFEHVVINVHHHAQMIVDYLKENDNFGIDIKISDETTELLDTGGGIKKARQLFDPAYPILIHNVDILSNVDLQSFYDGHADHDATLLVSNRQTKRYLLFSKEMRMQGWTNIETGEVKAPGTVDADARKLAFSGIHIFSPRLFGLMDRWPEKFGITDFYIRHCGEADITGYEKKDLHLIDVGKLDTLSKAEEFIKTET